MDSDSSSSLYDSQSYFHAECCSHCLCFAHSNIILTSNSSVGLPNFVCVPLLAPFYSDCNDPGIKDLIMQIVHHVVSANFGSHTFW